jgi:hypothetical protein
MSSPDEMFKSPSPNIDSPLIVLILVPLTRVSCLSLIIFYIDSSILLGSKVDPSK